MNKVVEQSWNSDELEQRLFELDALLVRSAWLWRPQPFKEQRPSWCQRLPHLCDFLLSLSDAEWIQLAKEGEALNQLLQEAIPELPWLVELTTLEPCSVTVLEDLGPHFHSGIPGRKWRQIEQFAEAVGEVRAPLLEWCGGKGHLGRLMAAQWETPVLTVEHDEALCREGERYAGRAGVAQRFRRIDALSSEAAREVGGHHAVALHACGELHRTLLRQALESGVEAFDIAPCCYYIGAGEQYLPFCDDLQLQLERDDLRLAVTETVTAKGREVAKRDQEMAWKLGYDEVRRRLCGVVGYVPIKPIVKGWLKLGFADFCRQLAQREHRELPAEVDWALFESLGWKRQSEVMRLSLVRAAFRRALEMWLVLDMATFIARQGYDVRLATFCDRGLTPRNILISARRAGAGAQAS